MARSCQRIRRACLVRTWQRLWKSREPLTAPESLLNFGVPPLAFVPAILIPTAKRLPLERTSVVVAQTE